jgi:uncharacterized protein YndB with AHSA1/START domain
VIQIRQEAEIAATAEKIFAAIVDFRGYDRWLLRRLRSMCAEL